MKGCYDGYCNKGLWTVLGSTGVGVLGLRFFFRDWVLMSFKGSIYALG